MAERCLRVINRLDLLQYTDHCGLSTDIRAPFGHHRIGKWKNDDFLTALPANLRQISLYRCTSVSLSIKWDLGTAWDMPMKVK